MNKNDVFHTFLLCVPRPDKKFNFLFYFDCRAISGGPDQSAVGSTGGTHGDQSATFYKLFCFVFFMIKVTTHLNASVNVSSVVYLLAVANCLGHLIVWHVSQC